VYELNMVAVEVGDAVMEVLLGHSAGKVSL
jgi:hypothetical protein